MIKRLIAIGSVWLVVGACGNAAPTSTPTPDPADPPAVATGVPLRTEEGVPGPLPQRAESSADVDLNFASGQEIFITDDGFVPKQLVAKVDAEILFINETDDPKVIRFVNGSFDSGPIPKGESASFTPDTTVSIAYELASDPDVRGAIQVESYYEPGESAKPEQPTD